jgi:hypothetical protein
LGQLLAQPMVPSVRHPNLQDIVVGAVHAPEPLQSAAVLAMLLEQLATAPQEVVAEG